MIVAPSCCRDCGSSLFCYKNGEFRCAMCEKPAGEEGEAIAPETELPVAKAGDGYRLRKKEKTERAPRPSNGDPTWLDSMERRAKGIIVGEAIKRTISALA